jgi:hypothetical protein
MLLNMKNFSDITAIDTTGQLTVRLTIKIHGNIKYVMKLNGGIVSGTEFTTALDLLSDIDLKVEVSSAEVGNGGLEIQDLSVNGAQVLPIYLHLARPATNYINEVGLWEFHIPGPFYPWIHDITGQGWIA